MHTHTHTHTDTNTHTTHHAQKNRTQFTGKSSECSETRETDGVHGGGNPPKSQANISTCRKILSPSGRGKCHKKCLVICVLARFDNDVRAINPSIKRGVARSFVANTAKQEHPLRHP